MENNRTKRNEEVEGGWVGGQGAVRSFLGGLIGTASESHLYTESKGDVYCLLRCGKELMKRSRL